ncbi:MAG: hemin-degrading factor [Hyphomicrobiales bacterium]|nr:hemin-degrading factor [Nitratireductor sp.]MCC2096886.1 hemin-degrading factor [Hyphomicrobiales bacterium]
MSVNPEPEAIRQARSDNPKMRPRDLAGRLGISEGEYVSAFCGHGVTRLDVEFDTIFSCLEALGEVMALTRNKSAVHEKIGVYDRFIAGKHAAMMLGEAIDMRMFPAHFVHGFAVETRNGDKLARSLQFFDAHGDAVHKIHGRDGTNIDAWNRLVERFTSADQNDRLSVEARKAGAISTRKVDVAQLRDRWSKLTDTHQFFPMLRKLEIDRLSAIKNVGGEFAWQVGNDAAASMLRLAAAEEVPIMCFVNNPGCIQIHAGPVSKVVEMGPWINVMDPGFHLHLRMDHIAEAWVVRKPTDKGHVTALEAYDADGNLFIQFFGKRIEGQDEREPWRMIMENLPRTGEMAVA